MSFKEKLAVGAALSPAIVGLLALGFVAGSSVRGCKDGQIAATGTNQEGTVKLLQSELGDTFGPVEGAVRTQSSTNETAAAILLKKAGDNVQACKNAVLQAAREGKEVKPTAVSDCLVKLIKDTNLI